MKIFKNLLHIFRQWRIKHLYLTPKEHSVNVLIAHQINREELERERLAYKNEAGRLIDLRCKFLRSRKVVSITTEFDDKLFVDPSPYNMAVIADSIVCKIEAQIKESMGK